MSIYSASELDSSFAGLDSTSASTSRFTVMGVPVDKMARGLGGGGNYLRKYIRQKGRLFGGGDWSWDGYYSRKYSKSMSWLFELLSEGPFFPLKKVHVLFSSTEIQYKFHVFSFRAFLCLRVVVFARLYKREDSETKYARKPFRLRFLVLFFFGGGVGGGGCIWGPSKCVAKRTTFWKIKT